MIPVFPLKSPATIWAAVGIPHVMLLAENAGDFFWRDFGFNLLLQFSSSSAIPDAHSLSLLPSFLPLFLNYLPKISCPLFLEAAAALSPRSCGSHHMEDNFFSLLRVYPTPFV